jgi:superfamily II DNA/RNA helicase
MSTLGPLVGSFEGALDCVCLSQKIEDINDTKQLYTEDESAASNAARTLNFDVLVITTTNLLYLLENDCLKGLSHKVIISDLVVDKVDLHSALDLDDELIKTGTKIQPFLCFKDTSINITKTIITTNEQDTEDEFSKVRTAFLVERKAVIVKLKEQTKSATMYESVGHLVVECDQELQKYQMLYSFIKFKVFRGRTLIFVDSAFYGYKIKIFLEKFHIRCAVLNPEGTKTHRKSAVRYFHTGQYDILILPRMRYSFKLKLNNVTTVVNFSTPDNIVDYDSSFKKLNVENGSIVTFTYSKDARVHDKSEYDYMYGLVKKQLKRYDRSLFVVLPINWLEVNRLKSRIDDIFCTLTSKKVKEYMANEIKKQILTNKRLKEYFDEHVEEKEILRSSVDSNYKYRFMNNNLDFVPDYLAPKSMILSEIEKELETFTPSQPKMKSSLHDLPNDLPFIHNLKNLPKANRVKANIKHENPELLGMF